jgi:hypothetical protein
MKKKNKRALSRKKKEFRFKNVEVLKGDGTIKIRHPAYIIVQEGNIYIYVTLTHSSNVDDKLVIELRQNPNPNDSKKTYYVAEIKKHIKDKFGHILKKWKRDVADDVEIRQLYKKDGSAK